MDAKKSDYKELFQDNIEKLSEEIKQAQEELDFDPKDFFPDNSNVDLDLKVELHDYEKDLEAIRSESKETLECLANLYLDEEIMKNKNINNIITNDALALSDLKFSISCSKRGLINLMRQIDNGIVDAELYQAVSHFQREMKDGIKMLYELQKNMKEFFKDLKEELTEKTINTGINNQMLEIPDGAKIVDKDINKAIDNIMLKAQKNK